MTQPARPWAAAEAGAGLAEALVALLVIALLASSSMPALASAVRRQRLESATRRLASAMHGARWRALASGRHSGLRLEHRGASLAWTLHDDGDGDGLRLADLRDGTDPPVDVTVRLEIAAPGVRVGVLADVDVPRLPPQTGRLSAPDDPVKFGTSDVVSFGPAGGATSGSLYLTDGNRMSALVLDGVTGRLRLFRFEKPTLTWKELNG